jgi:hypothetical protein
MDNPWGDRGGRGGRPAALNQYLVGQCPGSIPCCRAPGQPQSTIMFLLLPSTWGIGWEGEGARGGPRALRAPLVFSGAECPPSGELWLHEIKHDGFRVIARKDGFSKIGARLERRRKLHLKHMRPTGAAPPGQPGPSSTHFAERPTGAAPCCRTRRRGRCDRRRRCRFRGGEGWSDHHG